MAILLTSVLHDTVSIPFKYGGCSMPIVGTSGTDMSNDKEDQGGVLHGYLQNPDA